MSVLSGDGSNENNPNIDAVSSTPFKTFDIFFQRLEYSQKASRKCG